MRQLLIQAAFCALLSLVSSTDLAAVYKQSVILLRDADEIRPTSPIPWKNLVLQLPSHLRYPVGLTHDPESNKLFISDAVHHDGQIFSLTFGENQDVRDVDMVVQERGIAVIEGLTYDPKNDHLYWTDATAHDVYKIEVAADIQNQEFSKPKSVHDFGNIVQPRGIAFDFCKEVLYWTERGDSGRSPSSIKQCDINGTEQAVVRQRNDEQDVYYQALTYDVTSGKIFWAETIGDSKANSSCRIVSANLASGAAVEEVLLTLDHCYPFSLTSDSKYIYWADWSQNGIMRASLSDPSDIVKLVHTPDVVGNIGKHHGAYGIATLNGFNGHSVEEMCKGKTETKLESDETKSFKENVAVVNDLPHDVEVNDYTDHTTLYNIEAEQEATTAVHDVEIVKSEKGEFYYDYDHAEQASKTINGSPTDITSKIDKNQENTGNDMASPAPTSTLESTSYENSAIKSSVDYFRSQIYSEKQLYIIVIIILAVCCVLFCSTTLGLALKINLLRRQNLSKEELPTTVSPLSSNGTPVKRPRMPKRFGPPKKSGLKAASTCSRQPGDDGVHINIEDCCQMTLCETPCYTSVKKEGKRYKDSKEDKAGLLENYDF